MELSQKSISVTSYNPTGLGLGAINFIDTLLLYSNILCLQEHFLQDSGDKKHSNTNKLRKSFPHHDMFITPAYKETNRVCRGRAKGGLATIWHPSLTKYVSKIKCENFRLQGTKFSFPSGSLLIVNSYFPCDPRKEDFDDHELLALLADLNNLIDNANCLSVLLAGDMNSHFARNTRFTNTIKNYFDDKNLKIFWETPNNKIQDVDYTHMFVSDRTTSFSTIDHFVSNFRVFDATTEAGVHHDAQNPSNHSPIYVKIDVGQLKTNVETCHSASRTSWAKASDEAKAAYTQSVATKLNALAIPECVYCTNLHCVEHGDQIENYTLNVLEKIEAAAKESLAMVGGSKSSRTKKQVCMVPGWNDHVKPFYEESKFWHSIWVSSGKPSSGDLLNIMRYSKHQYKYALRRVQRASNKIQDDKFLAEVLKGGGNIFKEIKKYRGKVTKCSSTVDGEVGAHNIAGHFADIYGKLYNQGEQGQKIINMQESLNRKISGRDMYDVNRITENVIKLGLKRMKGNKSDAIFDFQSNCLINGPSEIVTHLTNMIRMFVTHGEVPSIILVCTLLPLVKDNLGDLTQSDNYRAIAAGCQLLKLLDIVILILEGEKLGCSQLQFGFQPKASTTMCSWAVTAVIDQYNRQGSVVYGCTMDLSKAFDMVEWLELFNVLNSRNVSPVFLRTLLFIYTNQSCNVKWNGSLSDRFNVANGVRQGAVSSPILFSIYIDDLFSVLRQSGLGCWLNGAFLGCFGYADDLLLLSASRSGLQSMVDICSEFMRKKSLKFSTHLNPAKSKTKCIIFSKKPKDRVNVIPVKLNGDSLPWVGEIKHLGNILECDNSMKRDITVKRAKFIGKVNSLAQEFFYASPSILINILNIYCTSFYGSGLWDMFSSDCQRLYTAWNVTVRHSWSVPNTTHKYLIEGISGSLHPKVMLASGYTSFVRYLLSSPKYFIRVLASSTSIDLRTVMGTPLRKISRECSYSLESLTPGLIKKSMNYFPIPSTEEWRIGVLTELLSADLQIPGFADNELHELTTFLCNS